MAGLIVVDLVASAPADESLAQSLVTSCSAAAGPGGCVLGAAQEARADVRAHVVVSFSAGYAAVHVEAVAPLLAGEASRARDITFREADPPIERFRAAGLVVAQLISESPPRADDAAVPPETPELAPPAPTTPARHDAPIGSLAWTLSPTTVRPRVGVSLGADIPVGPPVFLTMSALYQQSWHRDATGISERRVALCVGAGLAARLVPGALDFRARVELEVEDLLASIQQPTTGQQDAGGRVVAGAGAGAELIWPMSERIGLFVGGRVAWLGSETVLRVHEQAASTIPAAEGSLALGLNARIP